jgi:hypothetical protein
MAMRSRCSAWPGVLDCEPGAGIPGVVVVVVVVVDVVVVAVPPPGAGAVVAGPGRVVAVGVGRVVVVGGGGVGFTVKFASAVCVPLPRAGRIGQLACT